MFVWVLISGTKHFLLMCNVRAEDSGEIKFVARQVESVAHLEVKGIFSRLNALPMISNICFFIRLVYNQALKTQLYTL